MIQLKSANEIAILRECNQIVVDILNTLKRHCHPGITTLEMDKIAEDLTLKHKARAAFKGYNGFPATLCTSVNQQVVHGIPSRQVLREGDIVSVDYGVFHRGFYGDAALTLPVGRIAASTERLLQTTRESLLLGIEKAVPGNHLGDISAAIQTHAEGRGYSLVKEFSGHGIGRKLHEEPAVLNYVVNGRGILLKPGLVLAIEPMVSLGTDKVRVLPDRWTVVTQDGKPSAHFEHSIAITENGPEILSLGI